MHDFRIKQMENLTYILRIKHYIFIQKLEFHGHLVVQWLAGSPDPEHNFIFGMALYCICDSQLTVNILFTTL